MVKTSKATQSGTKQPNEKLETALDRIRNKYGIGAIAKAGETTDHDVKFIPTGIETVDNALGGGIPRGRMTECHGPESSGKTTLAFYAIASAQREGEVCAFIDVEHAMDPIWARKCGVDLDELLFSQPSSGEEAWEIILELAESNSVAVIVLDSITALMPLAEAAGDMTDANMALAARMNSKGLRKLVNIKHDSAIIFINQLRSNIGNMYGPVEVTTGGKGFKYYCSVRIRSAQKGAKADRITMPGEIDPAGLPIEITVIKNKVAPPLRTARFDLLYDSGVDLEGSLLDYAVEVNAVGKKGAWYYDAQGEQIGQGRQAAIQHLRDNPDYVTALRELVRAKKQEKTQEKIQEEAQE